MAGTRRLVAELRVPAGWEETLQWLADDAGLGPLLASWDFPSGAVGDEADLRGVAADRLVLTVGPEREDELRARCADWAQAFGWSDADWSLTTELREVDDDQTAWQRQWRPFRCAGFEVCAPFHDLDGLAHRADCTRVILEPGSAFGTGGHATTRMGLRTLRRWAEQGPATALLDVGTGSGILAVAAALLGVPRVLGMDPDPASPAQAARMAERNGVAERCSFWRGTLDSTQGGWPWVTANLVADLHREHAPRLAALLAPGGRLYAGGIRIDRMDEVRSVFLDRGLRVETQLGHGRWRGLDLRRPRQPATD